MSRFLPATKGKKHLYIKLCNEHFFKGGVKTTANVRQNV